MAHPRAAHPGPDAFRTVLGRFTTGVSVMTTVVDDVPHGMTASAVASVSLEPPLVLVCVDRTAAMADLAVEAGVFALSFLAADQATLSAWFADPNRPADGGQFAGISHRAGASGCPLLEGALAWTDCRVSAVHEGGDHLIVVGEVVDLALGTAEEPLVYYASGYRGLRG